MAARTNDEVWVANHISDSVSVVSVSQRRVIASIPVGDEPSDVAFALSGNRTVALNKQFAPPPQAPTNPNLPAPPQVALIVDHRDPQFAGAFAYQLDDDDVTEVDVAARQIVRSFARVGTVNLGMAVRPGTGDLFVANTDSRNLIRFLPNLRGHVADNRVTRVTTGAVPSVTAFALNPGINYAQLPNPAAVATSLAQPTAVEFDPSGAHCWVAAFATDRIAKVDPTGVVLERVDLGVPGPDPVNMRGPRGLALRADVDRLYVTNRVSNMLSIIDTATNTVLGEVPIGG